MQIFVMSACTSDSKEAVFDARLNKCIVYKEEDILSYKTRMF